MNLKFKRLHEDAILPTRAHFGDAGLDLYSVEDADVVTGEVTAVSTGLAVEIPDGYVGLVHPRSGLAFKEGVTVVNAPGTIDAGYRGEVKVALTTVKALVDKLGMQCIPVRTRIKKGDRVAQLVVQAVELPVPVFEDELPDSERGTGGYGSTGN